MVYNVPNKTELSGFYVVYNGVVTNESEGSYGISHFLEHLICKNLDDDFTDLLERNGITWNAYTTPNNVVFYIKGLDDYVYKFKDEFLNKITKFDTTLNTFENEKKIILEEYSDLFNRYNKNHYLNLYRKVLNNYNSVGKKDNILNFTMDDCYNYYSKFYYKPSSIVYISKNYKQEEDITTSIQLPNKNFNFGKYKFDLESPIYSTSKSSIIYLSSIVSDDFDKIIFINYMLSGGLKSPLYKAIREKNSLAYYINCRIDRINENGVIVISTETSDENVDKLNESIADVFKQKSYLNEEKFDIIKQFIKISLMKSNINLQDNEDKFILPKSWLIENTIDSITYDDIIDTFDKYFNINDFYKSVNKTEFS